MKIRLFSDSLTKRKVFDYEKWFLTYLKHTFRNIRYKVNRNRCLARYSSRATTTNQMSRQGLAQNKQKCHFQAKLGCFWAKNPNFSWRNQKFCYPYNGSP